MKALIAAFLVWSVFVSFSHADQRKFNDIPEYAAKSIETLAGVLGNDEQFISDFLEKRGFPPAGERLWRWLNISALNDSFDQWPAIRKLEAAYQMAEKANPGTGEQLIRDLAEDIAISRNVAIIAERSLSKYFPNGPPRGKTSVRVYEFRHMTRGSMSSAIAKLRPDVRGAIEIVSRYSHALPGGTVRAMAHCCAIAEAQAFGILREAESLRDAIYLAVKMGTMPPALLDRADRLIEIARSYNAAISTELETIYAQRQETKINERVQELVQSGKSDAEIAADPKIRELLAAGVAGIALKSAVDAARRPRAQPLYGSGSPYLEYNAALSAEIETIYAQRQKTKINERVQSVKSDAEIAADPKIRELLAAGVAGIALKSAVDAARRTRAQPLYGSGSPYHVYNPPFVERPKQTTRRGPARGR